MHLSECGGQLVQLSVCGASWCICQSSGPAGAFVSLVFAGPAGAFVSMWGQLVHLSVCEASWCICQSAGPAGASVSFRGQLVHLLVWGPAGASVSLGAS